MAGLNPVVPIPRGPIMAKMNVTQLDDTEWEEAVKKCQRFMPMFFEPYRHNHPASLYAASECVEMLLLQIETTYEWRNFRDQMQRMVARMNGVKTMVCLGLGQYVGPVHPGNMWIAQYAVFAYMWRLINRKWQNECRQRGINPPTSVQRFFQDPAIDTGTRHLLEKIARNTDPEANLVVEHPAALDIIKTDKNTFVFAPHLPCRLNLTFLACRPQLFIGNSKIGHGGWISAMVEEYMEECHFEGITTIGQRVNDLWNKIQVAEASYSKSLLIVQAPVARPWFGGTSIYVRRD
jgi:hypothetical protein